jgi:hypothetical protein
MLGPGQSSQSIWTPFESMTTAIVRPLRARCLIAWTREQQATSFAVIGSSLIGGTDIVQGVGDNAINNADLYNYFDETDRVMRLEYERHLIEPLGGTAIAMADITLDNTDLRFTPDYNATIGTALKPNRPIKLFIGFEVNGQEMVIPIIEGLSLQPKENKMQRTVRLSAYDFMKFLNEKPQETTIYQNQRSDQIIADILARAGIGSANYSLDQGLNTIGFAWFEKGQTAGNRIRKICEAEEAIFYQDEQGIFRFENRDKYSKIPYNSPVWTIEADDILEWETEASSDIINRAIIKGSPRTVKGETEIWRDGIEEEIPAGTTLTIWAQFDEPVSSITAPDDGFDYQAFTATAGGGSDITNDISIVITSFTKTAKIEITNANASTAYLNLFRLRGTPATVDYEIAEVYQDDDSVDTYNEYQEELDNEFIDDRKFARNMAQNLVRRHRNPLGVLRLKVRGIPQLQLRDQIRVKDMDLGTYKNYRLIGIQGVFEPGSFIQILTLREITDNESL